MRLLFFIFCLLTIAAKTEDKKFDYDIDFEKDGFIEEDYVYIAHLSEIPFSNSSEETWIAAMNEYVKSDFPRQATKDYKQTIQNAVDKLGGKKLDPVKAYISFETPPEIEKGIDQENIQCIYQKPSMKIKSCRAIVTVPIKKFSFLIDQQRGVNEIQLRAALRNRFLEFIPPSRLKRK